MSFEQNVLTRPPCHNFLSGGEGCWQVVCETCFGGSDHVLRTYHNLLNEGTIVTLVTFTKEHSVDQANHLSLFWWVKDGLAWWTAGNHYSKRWSLKHATIKLWCHHSNSITTVMVTVYILFSINYLCIYFEIWLSTQSHLHQIFKINLKLIFQHTKQFAQVMLWYIYF